jgi:hypothetical protein
LDVVSCTVRVTVDLVGLPTLTLSSAELRIYVDTVYPLAAVLRVGHTKVSTVGVSLVWASEYPVTATASGGVVTGVASGMTRITVSCVYNGVPLSAECAVTVLAAP